MGGKTYTVPVDATDKEKFIALLDHLEIGFNEGDDSIVCGDMHERVTGYSGFYTEFEFNDDGDFISMGAWE